jgi:hypothetical protein
MGAGDDVRLGLFHIHPLLGADRHHLSQSHCLLVYRKSKEPFGCHSLSNHRAHSDATAENNPQDWGCGYNASDSYYLAFDPWQVGVVAAVADRSTSHLLSFLL